MREGAPAAYEPEKESEGVPPQEALQAKERESANPVPGDLNEEQSAKLSEALQSIRQKYGDEDGEEE